MAVHRARDPQGRDWIVERHWSHRIGKESLWGRFWRRFRAAREAVRDHVDPADGCAVDLLEGIFVSLVLVVVAVFLYLVGLPLLFALLDVVVVLLLAVLGAASRVLFKRPWIVQATSGRTTHEWRVVGWKASGQFAADLAERLQRGEPIPPPSGLPAV